MVEIDVVGRHALLFDDDATAAFVNSNDALVEWNSLLIDRYDVRHLLSSPPPSRRRRNQQQKSNSVPSISSIDADLDYERYLDLPPPSDEQEADDNAKPGASGGYGAVPFSYGNTEDPGDQKNSNSESPGFQPPFPVPDSLIHNIPQTEKLHQIIARTALFVSKHGGQSEIVLRVKQGDNPTFGFLMPDHHLHAYFRFLVDNQELLQSKDEGNLSNPDHGAGGGALSLLGSLYGTGEDEEGTTENAPSSKENTSGEAVDGSTTVTLVSDKTGSLGNMDVKDEDSKPSLVSKGKGSVLRRNSLTSLIKGGSSVGMSKGDLSGSVSTAPEKSRASSLPPIPKAGHLFLEPPSDVKRLVDKIVEFILKNGKQFEAVLMEQDREHGRFPFLMPSNQHHPYYLKVLQKAQESKSSAKISFNEKGVSDKKGSASKKSDSHTFDFTGSDIPYDSDRKEKFKMIIGKSKKEGSDLPPKDTQPLGVSVDASQVAAILQAATRGIKNPDLGNLNSTRPENASVSEGKVNSDTASTEVDSSGSHLTREQKLKAERLKRAKMFMAMLKNGDAPSNIEPSRGLSAEPQEMEASVFGVKANTAVKERDGSLPPLDVDSSGKTGNLKKNHFDDVHNERKLGRKYRSRSGRHEEEEAEDDKDDHDGAKGGEKRVHKHRRSKPHQSSVDNDKEEQSEDEASYPDRRKHKSYHSSSEDDNDEEKDRKSRRKKHRSRHSSHNDDNENDTDEEMDYKSSRKKHRSRHSYRSDEEEDEHDRDSKYSRKNHRSYRSSRENDGEEDEHERDNKYSSSKRSSRRDDEEEGKDHIKHSRKRHQSHRSSHHSRDGHKHRKRYSSPSKDHRESRHRHKHDSSDVERRLGDGSDTVMKESPAEKDDLEEGEISPKVSDQSKGYVVGKSASREPSVDISLSKQDERASSQPSDTLGVSDDLRAKIRAMLMSTM